jgi:hypothetical protein
LTERPIGQTWHHEPLHGGFDHSDQLGLGDVRIEADALERGGCLSHAACHGA